MINSYSEIKSKVEDLYRKVVPNSFLAICNKALGGKRGLSRTQLIQAMGSGSMERIHSLLEPVVNGLLIENQKAADAQEGAYNVMPLGENEYRLIKTENKDKYGRGANDYIINTTKGSCSCPEFINRLGNIFLPCKHQYMVNVPVMASTIDKKNFRKGEVRQLLKVADSLDRKSYFKLADMVERIILWH